MGRLGLVCLLLSGTIGWAAEPGDYKLPAPEGWGGESIQLPPGFARDMKLQGWEHIRFAPGMFRADSDSFFSYAFVFELQADPPLTKEVVDAEFLKYYRGLCRAVLGGKQPEVDPADFTLELSLVKSDDPEALTTEYSGQLNWVEPFATKKPQQLQLEIHTWTKNDRAYLFACVSPHPAEAKIWQELRKIRTDYFNSQKVK